MQELDPYLLWAVLTDYRDIALDSNHRVGVIIECDGTVAELQRKVDDGTLRGVQLPAIYRNGVIDTATIRHCTAWVERDHLEELASQVKRFKLGMAVDGHKLAPAPRPGGQCEARVVVGIVDDFVAFAHPAFADTSAGSRVRFVWSQDGSTPTSTVGAGWQASADTGYGYELSTAERGGGSLQAAYPAVLRRATHGTHVADLAAGHRQAGAGKPPPDIVAVHLPRRGVADTSGSALKMQALDALHYIVERAGPQAGVVVNLSYGTMAGAHDGQSIIEQAISELVAVRAGQLSVVVPAGNSYEARCHAVLRLNPKSKKRTLKWNLLPDDLTPSFLEIWLPEGAAEHIQVKVSDPNGRSSRACGVGQVWPAAGTDSRQVDFALIFLGKVADSPVGTMILIALAGTVAKDPGTVCAPAGIWTVELSHSGAVDLGEIHAWIERDDTLPGRPPRGRQSYFVDAHYTRSAQKPGPQGDSTTSQVKRSGSFNSIATGGGTVVVGGFVGHSKEVAHYSGGGPTRGAVSGPTLLACSEESPTLHGLRAAATLGVDKVRMNGTSVAAPQVTRQIALCLSKCSGSEPPRLSAEQLLTCLLGRVKGPLPGQPLDPREGHGRLPS